MSRIKILHVLDVEKEAFYFTNLVDNLDPQEFEAAFITFAPEGDFTKSISSRGMTVYGLNLQAKKDLPRAAKKVWQIMREENPQIVHTHLQFPSTIALNIAKLQKRKTVLTRHHSDAIHLLPSAPKRVFYLALEKRNNRLAGHIVAPSQMVRDCIVDWEKTPVEKVSVIPYGQTTERFDKITPRLIDEKRLELKFNGQTSLVCVSRLFNRKGHEFLFRGLQPIIERGSDLKLFLVGTGDFKPTLEKLASELGISQNIEFLGWRADALEIIAAADLIVHPSLEDALSQSLIESLMLRRPIIATDISGAADTLDGGKYGKLVPPADAIAFQAALEETLADLDGAKKRAAAGREYLLDYMNAKRTADEHAAIYRKLLNSK